MIVAQLTGTEQCIDHCQGRGRAITHGECGRAVERDHRRIVGPQQHVVQAHDLSPVCRCGTLRFGVHRRDCRLQRVRPETPRPERALHQRRSLGDHRTVPARTILLIQQNQLSVSRSARGPTRLVQEHQRQQSINFRLRQ